MPTGGDWSVWICTSCRRRVPGHLVECRCGALRAHALGVIAPAEEAGGSSVLPRIAMGLVLAVAMAGAWWWFQRAPEVIPRAPQVVAVANTAAPGVQPPPVAAPDPPVATPFGFPGASPTWPPATRIEPEQQGPGVQWAPNPAPTRVAAQPGAIPTPLSDWDRARLEGRRRLASEFAALAGNARRLIGLVQRYEGMRCQGRDDGDCRSLLEQIGRTAIAVGAAMERTEDIARTSLIDPGVVRDMRAQHGLDDSLWDQIERITREYRR